LFFRQKYWQDSIELSVLRVLRGNFKLLKTNSFWKKNKKTFVEFAKKRPTCWSRDELLLKNNWHKASRELLCT
jgi:hypothetical protein